MSTYSFTSSSWQVEAQGEASSLESLDLGACHMSAAGTSALCAVLVRVSVLPRLRCVELFGNESDAEAVAGLRAARPEVDVAWKQSAEDAQEEADGADGADGATVPTGVSEGEPAAPPATRHDDDDDDDDDAPPDPGGSW